MTGSEGKTCRRKAWRSGAGAWTCSWERQLRAASPEPADCASDLPQTPRAMEEEWPGWLFSLLFSWRKSSKEKRLPHCDSLLSFTRDTHTQPRWPTPWQLWVIPAASDSPAALRAGDSPQEGSPQRRVRPGVSACACPCVPGTGVVWSEKNELLSDPVPQHCERGFENFQECVYSG